MVNTFSESNIQTVKDFFKKNLLQFHLLSEACHGPNWEVRFANDEIEVKISGDIGFSIELFINNSKYDLWQFDRSVNKAMETNKENILYQLNILKKFLSEAG